MTPDNQPITARFKNWEEIFPDPAEADRQYSGLVADLRAEYSGNQTLRREKIEVNPQTGLSATIFEKILGRSVRVERLPDGNVRYEFNSLSEVHIDEVVPQAGNKDHDWTLDQIVGLRAQAAAALAELPYSEKGLNLAIMLSYLRGKPATMEWEEIMLRGRKLPQRVGFKIYPDVYLSAAKDL